MTTTLTVYVKGTPRPQPRPRWVNNHPVSTGSKVAKAYKAVVLAACCAARATHGQIKGPVRLDLDMWFAYGKRAERAGKWHTFKPDADNVVKLWQDCAQKAGLIEDDSHVSLGQAPKMWSALAGAVLTLTALGDGPETTRDDDDDDLGALTDLFDVV